MPDDIYPDSGNRLPLVKREDLAPEHQHLYDRAAGDSRSLVGLRGPGGIRLHSPVLYEATRPSSEYLRFNLAIGPRLTELAILVTARELDSQFEWTAHEPAALRAGVPTEVVEVVKHRKPPDGLEEADAVVIRLGREVLSQRRVSTETFAVALRLFGPKDLVDLVSLMGNYAGTAILLAAFDQQLPPGQEPLLPT